MDDVTKNRLLVGAGLVGFGALFWYVWKHGTRTDRGPTVQVEETWNVGPFSFTMRRNKARRKGKSRNPVIVAARRLVLEFGMGMGDAVRAARKAKASMPGHPSAQAIFAEVRLKRRGGELSKMKAGTGSRFKATVAAIMRRGIPKARAQAIAAAQARKALGARYFAELSKVGRARKKARSSR